MRAVERRAHVASGAALLVRGRFGTVADAASRRWFASGAQLLTAWTTRSNEIVAMPKLLESPDVNGRTVTANAIAHSVGIRP